MNHLMTYFSVMNALRVARILQMMCACPGAAWQRQRSPAATKAKQLRAYARRGRQRQRVFHGRLVAASRALSRLLNGLCWRGVAMLGCTNFWGACSGCPVDTFGCSEPGPAE